jgi:ABC-type nitrate/sulfonate/bicarbonate transport system ATPase subunit
VVFQEYVLFPWRTARQNVELGRLVGGLAPPERQRVERLVKEEVLKTGLV